jgi:hypothetical protein
MHKHKEKIFIDREEKVTLIEERETISENNEIIPSQNCCTRCKGCLDSTFIGVRFCYISIRNAICNCFGTCFFPIKERCCNCCDDIDKNLNPYKNPTYNPYDHL